jgi:glycosyltransferase involved in cell wall biosynthesis/SAM-dependent methyltransferase
MQLIVLGMHRSGTSSVARLLNMMGAYFAPPGMSMPPTAANAKGYWEREDIRQINDAMLQDLGCRWDNVADFDASLINAKFIARYSGALRKIVYELDAQRPWMAKDPRFCLLLPVWEAVLEVPVYIYVYRAPVQIAKSLAVRENNSRSTSASALYSLEQAAYLKDVAYFPLSLGFALWEKYTLSALKATSDIPKILISYHDLMRQPLETAQTLYQQLEACDVRGLRLPSEREIRAFIDASLYHQKDDAALQDAYMNPQQSALARAFADGSLLRQTSVPQLSAGAQEALNSHRDSLLAAAHLSARAEELHHEQSLHAEKNAELAAVAQQLNYAREENDTLRRAWQDVVAQLARVEAQLKHVEAQLAQQHADNHAAAAQHEAEKQAWAQLSAQFKAEKHQLLHQFNTLSYWVNGMEIDIDAIFNSLTWRSGDFLNRMLLALLLKKPGPNAKDHINQIRAYIAQYKTFQGLDNTDISLPAPTVSAPPPASPPVQASRDYPHWLTQYDRPDKNSLRHWRKEAQSWKNPPLISVIMPVYNTVESHLRAVLDSVLAQIYEQWELCIADDASSVPHVRAILEQYAARDARIKLCFRPDNGHISASSNSALELASGTFSAFLDHDDYLAPYALFAVAKAIQQYPDAMLLYSDEDKIDEQDQRQSPHFKPAWNPALLLSYNYLNHLAVYRTDLLKQLGGLREAFEGAQDYDLALRAIEKIDPGQIVHIPLILYHWRISATSTAAHETQKPYALQAAQRAISEHLQRIGVAATVSDAPELSGANRVRYTLPAQAPLVTLIVPTYNGLDLLRQCVDSVQTKTDYPNYEILIVDNRSDDPATLDYLSNLEKQGQARVLRYPQPFNYAAINNMAVQHAQGELLCLLNNDIEVISPAWLSEMVAHALQPGVGAVGARLWYPNNTLQHGGVIVGLGGVAGHSHKYFPRGNVGYFGRTVVTQNLSAVTAACMVLPKAVYLAAGGMEEKHLRVAFNDVDFCLKIGELGLRIVWTPYADLYHHESVSRGQEDTPEKIARFQQECAYIKKRWGQLLLQDPAYSPNLTLDTEDFAYAWPPRATLSENNARIFTQATAVSVLLPAPSAAPVSAIPTHLRHRQPGYALLNGAGVEIGAFNQPAILPANCQVEYGDAHTKEEIAAFFPEIDRNGLVEVQYILDLDTQGLSLFKNESRDFVILNHVLEHIANPIKIVAEVFRVLKSGGHAVLSIPDKRYTFDKHRPLTPFHHLLQEYEQDVSYITDEHYLDFLHAVHPTVFNLSREQLAECVANTRQRREHAHVWDSDSFAQFLHKTLDVLAIQAESVFVSRGEENEYEYFSVWRKQK